MTQGSEMNDLNGRNLAQAIKLIELEQDDSWFLSEDELVEMDDEIEDLLDENHVEDEEDEFLWDEFHPHEADEYFEPISGQYIPEDELE